MFSSPLHLRRMLRSLISAALVLLIVAFPAGRPVFAICAPAATAGADLINCDGANDTINALAGNDQVNAGAGNDSITGGAGNDVLTGGTGNDSYAFNTNSALGTDIVTEAAGEGTDTLDFTGSTGALAVNLNAVGNQAVNANLTLNLSAAEVENITGGSGNDTLTGNALDNIFNAGAGNDTMTGGAGNDTMTGGTGNDTYTFNTNSALGTDTVTEAAAGGTDTLDFTGSTNAITLNLNTVGNQVVNGSLTLNMTAAQVENITAGSNDDTLTGNALANVFVAGAGNDTMTGGAGNDTMTGGAGNDTYLFNTSSALGTDIVTEAAAGGTDSLDFTGSTNAIAVNLGTTGNQVVNANLTLNMSAAQVENVTAGSNNDTLTGNALNNIFIGAAGNDTYAFNTSTALGTDTVTEVAGGGTDTLNFTGSTNAVTIDLNTVGNQVVNGNLTLNLTAAEVENVTGGNSNDVLTGNAVANIFSAGNGNDTMTGGAGNDTMTGGAGNDTYLFNTNSALGTDIVTEAAAGGTDILDFTGSTSAITVNLNTVGNQVVNGNLTLNMTAAQVENVTAGSNNDILTGNALNNVFMAGAGNDTMTGGAGNDTMTGAAGNDTYTFNTNSALGTDIVTEAVGGGTDTLDFTGSTGALAVNLSTVGNQVVNANLTLNMTAAQVENVTAGSNNDTLTGNAFDNIFNGGAGNDTMTGAAGNDTLTGGAGNDTYAFNTNTALGTDTVTEAAAGGTDTLDFTGSTGAVSVNLNTVGSQVVNGNLTLNMSAAEVENVTGGSSNDVLTGNAVANVFSAGAGNDTMTGGAGNDTMTGGAGNDTYLFNTNSALGTDIVTEAAGGGTDTLDFTGSTTAIAVNLTTVGNQAVNGNLTLNMTAAQIENITAGSNNDTLTGNALNNIFIGAAGNDTYAFNTSTALGTDTVTEVAGGGTDTLNFTGSTNAVTVNLNTVGNQVVNSNLTLNMTAAQVENITGGSSNDTLTGNALDNIFNVGAGDDTMTGGAGNDTMTGGAGNDRYLFNTNSALGTDVVTEAAAGGTDTLDFTGSTSAVVVNLNTVGNQAVNGNLTLNMTTAQVENVTGGSSNDTLTGNGLDNIFIGGAGNDTITGAAGNDTMTGGAGNDTMTGGAGNDTYAFNTSTALGTDMVTEAAAGGTDTLDFTGSTNAISVNLGTTGNQAVNGNLTLNMTAAQVENVNGGSNNDTLTGNALDNVFNGGAGNDVMTGGAGNDTMTGGAGNDTYAFNTNSALGTDTVTEAAAGGTDTLNFSGSTNAIALNLNTVGNQVVNGNLTLNMAAAEVDNVTGGSNNDTLTGNALANILTGGGGNDAYSFNTNSALGTDTVTEAAAGGTDSLDFTGSTDAIAVNLGTTGNQAVNANLTLNMTAAQVENVTGGSNNDTLTGNALNNIFNGGAGDDTYAFNTSTALGTDTVTEAAGGGTDTLDFTGSTNTVTVDLNTVGNQTVSGNLTLNLSAAEAENITGGNNSDILIGNAGANVFSAGNGNDTMTGGAGDDTMTGGAGNDTYAFNTNSALGTDIVTETAGEGADTLDFTGSTSAITVDLGITGNQVINGNLTLNMTAAEVENVTSGSNNDTLTGNSLDNVFVGGAGNDTYAFNTSTALGTDIVTEAAGGGTDTLDFSGSTNAVSVDLGTTGNQAVNGNLTLNMSAGQIENLTGGSNNDTLAGNAFNNVLVGGAGDDTYAFNTNSALGTDTVTEASSAGTDTLDFSNSTNVVTVDLNMVGNQVVNGNLTLNMTAAEVENVTGGSNDDVLTGNAAANVFIAGNGNDTMTGGAGNDTMTGGAGNDTYVFNTNSALGTDTVTEAAGGGTDTLDFSGSTNAITVDLGTTGNQAVNANLTLNITAAEVENVTGGSSNDSFTSNGLDNIFIGGAGDDTYLFNTNSSLGTDTVTEAAGGGTDTLDFSGSTNAVSIDLGTTGNQAVTGNLTLNMTAAQIENVTGGSNDDTFTGNALDNVLVGGAGNDTYVFNTNSALGSDTVTEAAAAGTDTLDFSNSTNVVTVDLNTVGNQVVNSNLMLNITASEVENVNGGSNDDILTGNSLDNAFDGGAGNDVLNGGDGNNTLNGGDGSDTLSAGAGDDTLTGGNDDDTYIFNTDSALGTDTINEILGGGTDTLDFSASSNTITVDLGTTGNQAVNGNLTLNMTGTQVENVTGGSSDDTLTGNTLNNVISGGDGNDTLDGGDGNDSLDGGAGNDTLTTSQGVDTIDGGADDDLLLITGTHSAGDTVDGGTGNNIFRFSSGTNGAMQLISNGMDTLDFSLFGTPVTIDLSNSGQQDAGGGLLLTLSGFFDIVYGSIFDDHITGNSLDNTVNGGNGNDTLEGGDGSDALNGDTGNDILDGGADTDSLDGGADTDTVQNYSAGDTHVNIENGFPAPATPASNAGGSHSQSGLSSFIPVTGGSLTLLSCEANPAILRTQNNSLIFFYDPCGYSVVLDDSVSADLLATLPNDQTYLAGISLTLLNGSDVINELSNGVTVKLKISDPSDLNKTITALYWDVAADHGAGAWVEVPFVVTDGYAALQLSNSGSYVLTVK